MKTIYITDCIGLDEWRTQARNSITNLIPPHQLVWSSDTSSQVDLFEEAVTPKNIKQGTLNVPRSFMAMAEVAICHQSPEKYVLLYRLLWRLTFENKNLLKLSTDDDVCRLNMMIKAVRRDAYKITAFLRFREVKHEGEEYFVAWYEPEHYTLERVLPFFQTRFRNMRWSILTPYRAAHWNGTAITLEDNPNPDLYPKEDEVEKYWLGYYASIFNPARVKTAAMLNQMPKKYWKTMPETVLIPNLLRTANDRVNDMIARGQSGQGNSREESQPIEKGPSSEGPFNNI